MRFCLSPGLELVPGTLPQARQGLWLRRFRKFHRWKSRRSEQRIHQRAILRPQPRYVGFEHADIAAVEQPLKEVFHVLLFLFTTSANGAGVASGGADGRLQLG